jgi:DNA-binding beta-propeller fold protein YncE
MTASPTAAELADLPPAATDSEPPVPAEGAEGTAAGTKRRRRKVALLLLLLGAFALLLGLLIWYLLFRQPLPAIPVIPTAAMPSYTTSVYGASRPVGVAVNDDGSRIYVAESADSRIVRIFDASGAEIGTMAPTTPSESGNVPVYIAIDPLTQEVYVSDRLAGTIHIYDAAGTFLREFVPPTPVTGWQPMGMAFTKDGSLYVTDLSTATVLQFDRQGQVVRELGAADKLSFPNGVAVDRNGNVYVTDSNNGRLLVYGPEGQVVARIGRGADSGKLGLPRGIAIDGSDRVFVVDTSGQAVQVDKTWPGSGQSLEFQGTFGAQGIGNGQFNFPNGVAVDGRGRIYVADSANDRVQVWSY